MIGFIFRGIFLIGVLTWYSASVWKLIDGYFKDQFRSYLEEEYRKNPRMKSDVQTHADDKTIPIITTPLPPETTTAPLQKIVEACELNVCAVEVAENDSTSNEPRKEDMTGGTSENEAVSGSTDKNAFQETATEPGLESRKPPDEKDDVEEPQESINHEKRGLEKGRKSEVTDQSVFSTTRKPRKEVKHGKRSASFDEGLRKKPEVKKQRVKTVTLIDINIRTNDVSDEDFWEFEEDRVNKQSLEGILVSELPFKPKADIGDLERVSDDEYCPLNLENEASCEETYKWP